jgi:hypothetical protein
MIMVSRSNAMMMITTMAAILVDSGLRPYWLA